MCIEMTEAIRFGKTERISHSGTKILKGFAKKCLNSSHTKLISLPSCWALGTLGAEVVTSQGTTLRPADTLIGGEVDIGALGGVCEGMRLPVVLTGDPTYTHTHTSLQPGVTTWLDPKVRPGGCLEKLGLVWVCRPTAFHIRAPLPPAWPRVPNKSSVVCLFSPSPHSHTLSL